MNHEPIEINPVGYVRNENRQESRDESPGNPGWKERAARMKAQRDTVSEIVLDGVEQELLDGIEGYSHILVIYWAHLAAPERRASVRKVHPVGNPEFPLVGVFATQSPVRPNSILVTPVRLLERSGNVLKVTGLDALDGSPVLDIKPYTPPRADLREAVVPAWMRAVNEEFDLPAGTE